MKTVGELLKEKRIEKKITKTEISKRTKINLKYINALEKDKFSLLPEAAFVKGFIRNYAKQVGLSPKQALAVFRRDYDQNVKGQVIPRSLTPSMANKRTIWNPRTTVIVVAAVSILTLATYFIYQYRFLTAAPALDIESPQENQQVLSTITVLGKTDSQAVLKINNQTVLVNEDGTFSQSLLLPLGTRTITIQATNRAGKTHTVQRTVHVEQ